MKIKLLGTIGLMVSLLGCTTTSVENLEKIRIGDNKSQVVESLGSPKFSFRQAGRDVWIYERYDENQNRQRQTLSFYQGTLVSMGPLQNNIDRLNQAEAASSMDEYERILDESREASDTGFLPF